MAETEWIASYLLIAEDSHVDEVLEGDGIRHPMLYQVGDAKEDGQNVGFHIGKVHFLAGRFGFLKGTLVDRS